MIGRRTEHLHYTIEQVAQHLRDAIAIVEAEGLAAGEHERLLVAVYQSLATKQITVEQVAMGLPLPPNGLGR